MREKILQTMAVVFSVEPSTLNENSSPDNVENWDSIRHMDLIIALEQTFDVEFTDDEIGELLSVRLIEAVLAEKV